jgi:two-component system response regulator DesR
VDPVKILIAEDNEDLRTTMIAVLDGESDFQCVAQTDDLEQVSALAAATSPHVIILDIELKGLSSLSRLPQLKREFPTARFLMFSGHALPALIDAALASGAAEYVLKSGDPYDLINAVRRCATLQD